MMVNTVTILSAVFCVISMISVFIGIYTIYINAHSARNRLFFALAMALAVWSFGFTFALSARSIAESLFWRRFSALGWGTFFSVMLHFFVIFTDHKTRIGKPWRTVLIYLPAAVTLLGFSYFPYLNPGQYRLTLTPLGWINIPCNNVWDWFFVIYYLSFTLCCFLLVWEWMKKEKNKRVRKQAALLLSTFPTVLVAGSVLDIFFNSVFSVKLPQIAPILMLYPAVVIFYLIKKHGLMKPESVDEDTALLSGQIHTTIINYFSNAFLAAAFLYIIAMYLFFKEADLNSVLAFSALLVIMGVIIQGIHRSRAGVKIKGILFGTILALMVPLATLKYIEWGGATVWAFPFILLIITLVFERRFIQISLAVSVLVTQILIWVLKPEAHVTIDAVDYVSRLGLFVIAIWFAYYIKKVFISKLNENKNQIASQKLTVEISSDFVGVSEDNIDAKINEALSQLGDFCDADRIYIYLFDATLQRLRTVGVATRRRQWISPTGFRWMIAQGYRNKWHASSWLPMQRSLTNPKKMRLRKSSATRSDRCWPCRS